MSYFDRPVLTGRYVRLEPLGPEHAEGLYEAGKDPDIWTWQLVPQPGSVAEVQEHIDKALAQHAAGQRVPWAQIDIRTGEVAGTTSYHDLDPVNRGVYIGHTYLGARWHRTGMNTESKLLLMERAFEELDALRVGWWTHHNNMRSQRAIERLGASREGLIRNHRIMPDGSMRHTAAYAIIREEWPAAQTALRARLR